jgi:hypothetical protein
MYKKLFTVVLVIGSLATAVFSQAPIDEFALSRLPVLSKTVEVGSAFAPYILPDDQPSLTASCLNGSRTLDAQMPWIWCYEYDKPTNFIRPQIRLSGFPDDDSWFLLIKNAAGAEIDRLTNASFSWQAQAPGDPFLAERWAERVPGRGIQIELHAKEKPRNLRVSIDQINVSFFQPGRKAITTGRNDMRDLLAAVPRDHRYYGFSRSIADIHLMMSDGSGRETNCTGFLLTQDLVMTNQHCISEKWQLETAKAIFGFESQPPAPTDQDNIPFERIEMQDPVLDFSILRLKWPARNIWKPAIIDSRKISPNQQLVLIQHPNDQPKVISLMQCTVQSVAVEDRPQYANDFYHLCDCLGGSSGSPIIDEATGRVVGLHHREIEKFGDDGVNLGVRMKEIVARISKDQTLFNLVKNSIQ